MVSSNYSQERYATDDGVMIETAFLVQKKNYGGARAPPLFMQKERRCVRLPLGGA